MTMKPLLLTAFSILGPFFSNGVLVPDSWTVEEKWMNTCVLSSYDPDVDVSAWIIGGERIGEDSVSVFIYSDILWADLPECTCGIDVNGLENRISIGNDHILLGDEMHDIFVSSLRPGRFWSLQNEDRKFHVVELSNISWTSVNGGSIYVVIRLDGAGNLSDHFSFRRPKEPASARQLIEIVEKRYPDEQ